MQSILSPEAETFSTPPSTPTLADSEIRPSLSRRSSRPSSLRLQQNASEWKPHVIVEESNGQPSPDLPPVANGHRVSGAKIPTPPTATQSGFSSASATRLNGAHDASDIVTSPASVNGLQGLNGVSSGVPLSSPLQYPALIPASAPPQFSTSTTIPNQPRTPRTQPMPSPCFVHSRLQDPSLNKWLEHNEPSPQDARVTKIAKLVEYPNGPVTPNNSATSEGYEFWHDEEGLVGHVTKQLAETAVGVREMSKQLGKFRSNCPFPTSSVYIEIVQVALEFTQ